MKVYYEKPTAHTLISRVIELAHDYENKTGVRPNKIEMTKEEVDIVEAYFLSFGQFKKSKESNQLCGMEIIIK